MPHLVKCFYCDKTFDRDKVPFIKVNARRYAHATCSEANITNEKTKEEVEKDKFYQMIKSIYGPDYNYLLINTQAEEYILKYGYTWSGMTGCLHWFYNINHGDKEEGHGGIGIIPFIYDEVKKYYQDIYKAQEKNRQTKIMREPVYFNIQSPRTWHRPLHLLNLEDDEDENR